MYSREAWRQHLNQLRVEGSQPVSGRYAAVGIGIVVLGMGAAGAVFMQTGHVPQFPAFVFWGLVAWMWGVALIHGLRHGRRAFPLRHVVFMLGATTFYATQLLPLPAHFAWTKDAAIVLFLIGGLWQRLPAARRRPLLPDSILTLEKDSEPLCPVTPVK